MAGGPWSSGFSLGFGPVNLVDASGLATDSMQILGYSSTQKLFYDEANTEAFYLSNVTSSTSLARVSPLFARDWLVFSGLATTWVYNPFGTSPYRNFSNVI